MHSCTTYTGDNTTQQCCVKTSHMWGPWEAKQHDSKEVIAQAVNPRDRSLLLNEPPQNVKDKDF